MTCSTCFLNVYMYSRDEKGAPNQRDIGSKKRDLMIASFQSVNGSHMFTTSSGCQEARSKQEEVPFGLESGSRHCVRMLSALVAGAWIH